MKLRRRHLMASGLTLLADAARPVRAQPKLDPIRFSADFHIYGATAPFFYGVDKGFFRDAGLDATVDGSAGSADAVRRVASGAYDFGCADTSTLVEFMARNPDSAPKMIMPIYDRFAAAVISLKPNTIDALKDLPGHSLGVGTTDAGGRILPALLHLQGINSDTIQRRTVDVSLRDSMLARHEVNAIIGFDYTTLFNLLGMGVKVEDVRLLYFADNGFNFFGQGLIVNPRLLQEKPDVARRVAIAVVRSWLETSRHPDEATDSIMRREPLSDRKLEAARLNWVLDRLVLTPNVRANGIGTMNMDRLKAGIAILADGFQMKSPPEPEQVFVDGFIPDARLRRVADARRETATFG
jgi:NitT/TauT family transport system substrate-binding protein